MNFIRFDDKIIKFDDLCRSLFLGPGKSGLRAPAEPASVGRRGRSAPDQATVESFLTLLAKIGHYVQF